jgi:hypothetical protein
MVVNERADMESLGLYASYVYIQWIPLATLKPLKNFWQLANLALHGKQLGLGSWRKKSTS